MSPFSNERSQWIEERLFCLARMAGELSANRPKYTGRLRMEEALGGPVSQQAYLAIQAERMQLMVEREVIQQYNLDQVNGRQTQ